jgi:hypothetical protein
MPITPAGPHAPRRLRRKVQSKPRCDLSHSHLWSRFDVAVPVWAAVYSSDSTPACATATPPGDSVALNRTASARRWPQDSRRSQHLGDRSAITAPERRLSRVPPPRSAPEAAPVQAQIRRSQRVWPAPEAIRDHLGAGAQAHPGRFRRGGHARRVRRRRARRRALGGIVAPQRRPGPGGRLSRRPPERPRHR